MSNFALAVTGIALVVLLNKAKHNRERAHDEGDEKGYGEGMQAAVVSANDAAFAKGYEEGRARDSIRYEEEIYECRRTGSLKKEAAVKLRENVMLDNIRLAHSDRELIISSEVSTRTTSGS